jgi:hypothetical protein
MYSNLSTVNTVYKWFLSDELTRLNWELSLVVVIWLLDLQLTMQSVPITTKFVSSNSAHGEVYSIQYYVIKFVSDLQQVGGFLNQ